MNGRGAVELVVAQVVITFSEELLASNVISQPLLTDMQFSGLVLMAFVTTMLAPITLKMAVTRTCSSAESADFCKLWDESKGTR